MIRSLVVSLLCIGVLAGPAAAITQQERCEATQMTASGKRILAKLRCRAKAKLHGKEISAACLDRAEKAYVINMAAGGKACLQPDDLVALGAASDDQMSIVVETLDTTASTIPDLSGTWQTRTVVRVDPAGGFSLDCKYYPVGQCPVGDLLSIADCTTTLTQNGTVLTQSSQCTTPPEAPVQLGSFSQTSNGTVDPVTGEWTNDGTVFVLVFGTSYAFSGEGVYSPDGQSMTGFSTAGFTTGPSLWLATTTGHRVN